MAHVSWRVILAGWETRTSEFARNDSGNVQFACTINWNGINWLRVHGTQSRKAENGKSSPITAGCYLRPTRVLPEKKLCTLLDLCVSSLRRGHANLLCIVPILTDDPRRVSEARNSQDNHLSKKNADQTLTGPQAQAPPHTPKLGTSKRSKNAPIQTSVSFGYHGYANPR